MYFKESTDLQLVESIIKIPEIYQGFNYACGLPMDKFTLDRNTTKKFMIGYYDDTPICMLIYDEPRCRTKAHFCITNYGRSLIESNVAMSLGINYLVLVYPEIKALTGNITVTNEKNIKFYKKSGAKVISYTADDNSYQMELRVQ